MPVRNICSAMRLSRSCWRIGRAPEYREALLQGQQTDERPILRLGLTAPVDELRAMARAEQRFWEVAGALRSDEIRIH